MSQLNIHSKEVQDIINSIAKEENLPIPVVLSIIQSQYKFIRDEIASIDVTKSMQKTILVPKWGKYSISQSKAKAIITRKLKRDANNS